MNKAIPEIVEEQTYAEIICEAFIDPIRNVTALCVRIVCTSNISTYNKWAK